MLDARHDLLVQVVAWLVVLLGQVLAELSKAQLIAVLELAVVRRVLLNRVVGQMNPIIL